ncbi:MAG: hypothetical protein R3192_01600 [Woeseiaceae bacterium]|nr:hypothetical protein [Woeseiaceae bacterium]
MQAAFLFCSDANARPDGKLDIQGVFNELYANDFPARQQRLVLVGVVEWPRELDGRIPFAVDLVDAAGLAIFSIEGHTEVDARPKSRAPAKTHFVLPMDNVMFPSPGCYRARINLHGKDVPGPTMHLLRKQ